MKRNERRRNELGTAATGAHQSKANEKTKTKQQNEDEEAKVQGG